MKFVTLATTATTFAVFCLISVALANPALLPKHEGYPMKNAESPVTGQVTANDPGQSDAHGTDALLKSAESVKKTEQRLVKTDNQRIVRNQGAGRLPAVDGPQITIDPPVKAATKVNPDRNIP
ncbi:MAG: hypothetical protein NNA18_09680 [Nitrospira sp.]|nr:hypothetical protein [Nitrospira sp.]